MGSQAAYFVYNQNIDLFVISKDDPAAFLDYASISFMNKTLDSLSDP
jgi:hypothetical protein